MQFLPVLALLFSSALAAPLDFDQAAVEAEFHPPKATEGPIETPEEAPAASVETPVETPAAPETPAETPVEAPETPAESPVEAPETPAETPVEAPEAPAAPEPETPAEAFAEAPETPVEAPEATETKPEETPSTSDDEASESSESAEKPAEETKEVEQATEPEQPAAPAQAPVVAGLIPTGAEAVMEGVTVRFALRSTWKVAGVLKRGYVLKITNGSDKNVCGVTFTAEGASDIWHLAQNEDGSFSTKDLHIAPGATANQYGYGSTVRTKPTVTAINFC